MPREASVQRGWIAPRLAAEFPELQLATLRAQCISVDSELGVSERLALLASRFNGRQAIALREAPIASAYRTFFRQIGIDPEQQRPPAEQAAVERLLSGGNPPQGRVADALLLALLETSVPVYGFDAELVTEPLGIDLSPSGSLLLADSERPLWHLFAPAGSDFFAVPKSRQILLAAVGGPGVPGLALDEALWLAQSALSGS
jgi:hypothetical protein